MSTSRVRVPSAAIALLLLTLAGAHEARATHGVAVLNLAQTNSNGSALCAGCTTSAASVRITADSDAATCGAGTNYILEIEVRLTNVAFSNVATATSAAMMKPNCILVTYPLTTINLGPGTYHWQAREVAGTVGPWVTFNAGNTAFVVAGGGGIGVAPNALAFGTVAVGGTSAGQNVTITSNGMAPLVITAISTTGSFAASGVNVPLTLNPGGFVTETVTFKPTMAGATMGTLRIDSNAAGSPTLVTLTGSGAAPAVTLAPLSYDFGTVPLTITSAPQSFTLTNTGSAVLQISNASVQAPFKLVNFPNLPALIGVGNGITFQATYTPTQVGAATGTVTIFSNDPKSPASIMLKGTGIVLGLNGAPNPIAYGSVAIGPMGLAQTLVLTNNTNANVTVSALAFAPMGPEWTLDNAPNLPAVVGAAGGSLGLALRFRPQGHGARTGTLTITSDAPNSPLTVNLSGNGFGPQIASSTNPLAFGSVNVTQTGQANLAIQNTGESALTVKSATFGGANGAEFSTTANFPIVVGSLASSTIQVAFAPLAMGPRTARVTLQSDDGLAPAFDVALTGTGTNPKVAVAPMSAAFGNVLVGMSSGPLGVSVNNTGDGPLTIMSVVLGGANANAFSVMTPNLPLVVPPGGSRTVSPVFTPTQGGPATAKLTIVTDDPKTMNLDVPMTGTGVAPMVAVDATMIDFGTQLVGRPSQTKTLTITNNGTAPLTIKAATVAGAQGASFVLTNPPQLPAVVAPGQKQPLRLVHTPAMVGMDSATLEVDSDDPMSPAIMVNLTGAGVSTVLLVSPMTIDFMSALIGGKSKPMPITITNLGTDPLTLVDGALDGAMSGWFTVESSAGMLLTGAKKTVNVVFAPLAGGMAMSTLTIKTTDGAIPGAKVMLLGTGVAPKLAAMPGMLDFGTVFIGSTTKAQVVTIMNVSAMPVTVASVAADMPIWKTDGLAAGTMIAPGAKATFNVSFAPTAAAPAMGAVSVTLMGAPGPEVMVAVKGTGTSFVGGGGGHHSGGCSYAAAAARDGTPQGLVFALGLGLLALVMRRQARR